MRERHLDGTVLISGAGGAVFESLARPDLFITSAERANVIGSRRKDRDAALIGIRILFDSPIILSNLIQIPSLQPFLRVLPYFYPVMQARAFSNCSYCSTSTGPLHVSSSRYAFSLVQGAKCSPLSEV